MKLIDLLIERQRRQEKYFKKYKFYAKKIKKIAREYLGEVKMFIFGSILRKKEVPRDIDLLIISPKLKSSEEKSRVRYLILKKIGVSSPFEIHLITPEEYRDWYRYFIKEKVEV
jgi:uncharacterized protein